jgi:hypothetical protein
MQKVVLLVGVFLLTIAVSCSNSIKPETKATEPKSMEEIVKAHTQEYCKCMEPVKPFMDRVNQSQDSMDMNEYQMAQQRFKTCFDPTGEKKAYGDGLSQEDKNKQKELFNTYRLELCPNF